MKAEKPAARKKGAKPKGVKGKGRKVAAAAKLPNLEPDHPNFDTILLKRARLATYRARRKKNRPDLFAK